MADRLSFDLTAADLDTSFKLAPEGWHKVVVDNAEFTEDNGKGNPQFTIWYKSTDDAFDGTVREWLTVTQKSINNAVNLAKVTGTGTVPGPDGGQFVLPDADDLVGKELEIKVVHRESDTKTDDDGNPIKFANVAFAGRRKVGAGAKAGTAAKGGKAVAKKAGGFSL